MQTGKLTWFTFCGKKNSRRKDSSKKVRGILAGSDRESPSESFSFSVYTTSPFFFMCLIATGRWWEIFYRACQQIFISPFNYHTTHQLLIQDVVRGRALQIRGVIEHLSIPKAFGVQSSKLNSKTPINISNINALLPTLLNSLPFLGILFFFSSLPGDKWEYWASEFFLKIEETSSFWLLMPMEKKGTFLMA